MPTAQARQVVEQELGGVPMDHVFEWFNFDKPLGSASVAQARGRGVPTAHVCTMAATAAGGWRISRCQPVRRSQLPVLVGPVLGAAQLTCGSCPHDALDLCYPAAAGCQVPRALPRCRCTRPS